MPIGSRAGAARIGIGEPSPSLGSCETRTPREGGFACPPVPPVRFAVNTRSIRSGWEPASPASSGSSTTSARALARPPTTCWSPPIRSGSRGMRAISGTAASRRRKRTHRWRTGVPRWARASSPSGRFGASTPRASPPPGALPPASRSACSIPPTGPPGGSPRRSPAHPRAAGRFRRCGARSRSTARSRGRASTSPRWASTRAGSTAGVSATRSSRRGGRTSPLASATRSTTSPATSRRGRMRSGRSSVMAGTAASSASSRPARATEGALPCWPSSKSCTPTEARPGSPATSGGAGTRRPSSSPTSCRGRSWTRAGTWAPGRDPATTKRPGRGSRSPRRPRSRSTP